MNLSFPFRVHALLVISIFARLSLGGFAVAQPQHNNHDDAISFVRAGGRRSLLAAFGSGPVISKIQNSIKNEIRDNAHDMEQQVAKLVAKQVGEQLVRDMNNITSGALNSMGFTEPEQLGQYIGTWAGWLVTVLTSAANTAVGDSSADVDAGVAMTTDGLTDAATTPTVASAGYGNAGQGESFGSVDAMFGNVTEADLTRLQQVLKQVHALELQQQQREELAPVAERAGTKIMSGGRGDGDTNRAALENGVAQRVWTAMFASRGSSSGSSSTDDDGDGGDALLAASFRAAAIDGGAPLGPLRGLTGANERNKTAEMKIAEENGGGSGGSDAATLAAVALRAALSNNDTKGASEAVTSLLESLRSGKVEAGGGQFVAVGGDGSYGGGMGESSSYYDGAQIDDLSSAGAVHQSSSGGLPQATARLEVLPLPARTPKPTQTTARRPPRNRQHDGANISVGGDLNVNVNVNVVPATVNMPNGGGTDACPCACSSGGGGLAGALASNLLDGFLPGRMRLMPGGGGMLQSSDGVSIGGGAVSMQQSAPQSDTSATGMGVRAATAAAAAAAVTAGTLLGARAGDMKAANETQVAARPLLRWRPLAERGSGSTLTSNTTPHSSGSGSSGSETRSDSSSSTREGPAANIGDSDTSRIGDGSVVNTSATSDGGGSDSRSVKRSDFWRTFSAFGGHRRRRQLRAAVERSTVTAVTTGVSSPISQSTSFSISNGAMGQSSQEQRPSMTTSPVASGTIPGVTLIPRRQLGEASVPRQDGSPYLDGDALDGVIGESGRTGARTISGGSGGSRTDAAYGPETMDFRDVITGGGRGDLYGTEYDVLTGAANSASSEQILDLIQALVNQVTGNDVVVKRDVEGAGGPADAGTMNSIETRQSLPYVPALAGILPGGGSTAAAAAAAAATTSNDKPANANVNPIVLPSLQRSGPDINKVPSGVRAVSCPPCKC